MFGHQDDDNDHGKKDEPQDESANTAPEQTDQNDAGAPPDAPADNQSGNGDGPVDDDHAWQHPGGSSDGDGGQEDGSASDGPAEDGPDLADESSSHDDQPEPISDVIAPAGSGSAQNPVPPMPINARDLPDEDVKTPHELIEIKQKALNELQPLLGQLDQSPEDKFRTLMMIIQASDDQDMIKQAYGVVSNIKDDKVRAQALLDIVNEINYFTQHPQN
jgi:hypothetical protein